MIPRFALALAGSLLAAALLGLGAHAAIPGEVIVASDQTAGKRAVMSALDGSGLALVDRGGDLTHGGAPRYFVHAQIVAGSSQLFSYREDCDFATQLTTDSTIKRVEARWSPDGRRVAYGGTRFDPSGKPVERGIFVGDVTLGADGRPVASRTSTWRSLCPRTRSFRPGPATTSGSHTR